VSASASAASRVPDSHRSGMSNMLVPPTPTSTGAAGSAPGGPHRPSPHMYQAQQQPMQTQGQGQGGPQKQLMSEKLMAAVNRRLPGFIAVDLRQSSRRA
jgi:hypothetical protein